MQFGYLIFRKSRLDLFHRVLANLLYFLRRFGVPRRILGIVLSERSNLIVLGLKDGSDFAGLLRGEVERLLQLSNALFHSPAVSLYMRTLLGSGLERERRGDEARQRK